jgi:hypothetical protein
METVGSTAYLSMEETMTCTWIQIFCQSSWISSFWAVRGKIRLRAHESWNNMGLWMCIALNAHKRHRVIVSCYKYRWKLSTCNSKQRDMRPGAEGVYTVQVKSYQFEPLQVWSTPAVPPSNKFGRFVRHVNYSPVAVAASVAKRSRLLS